MNDFEMTIFFIYFILKQTIKNKQNFENFHHLIDDEH